MEYRRLIIKEINDGKVSYDPLLIVDMETFDPIKSMDWFWVEGNSVRHGIELECGDKAHRIIHSTVPLATIFGGTQPDSFNHPNNKLFELTDKVVSLIHGSKGYKVVKATIVDTELCKKVMIAYDPKQKLIDSNISKGWYYCERSSNISHFTDSDLLLDGWFEVKQANNDDGYLKLPPIDKYLMNKLPATKCDLNKSPAPKYNLDSMELVNARVVFDYFGNQSNLAHIVVINTNDIMGYKIVKESTCWNYNPKTGNLLQGRPAMYDLNEVLHEVIYTKRPLPIDYELGVTPPFTGTNSGVPEIPKDLYTLLSERQEKSMTKADTPVLDRQISATLGYFKYTPVFDGFYHYNINIEFDLSVNITDHIGTRGRIFKVGMCSDIRNMLWDDSYPKFKLENIRINHKEVILFNLEELYTICMESECNSPTLKYALLSSEESDDIQDIDHFKKLLITEVIHRIESIKCK